MPPRHGRPAPSEQGARALPGRRSALRFAGAVFLSVSVEVWARVSSPWPLSERQIGVSAHDPNSRLCREPSSVQQEPAGETVGRAVQGSRGARNLPGPAWTSRRPPGLDLRGLASADRLWNPKPGQGTGMCYLQSEKVASGLPPPGSQLVADWDALTSSTEEGGGEDTVSGR